MAIISSNKNFVRVSFTPDELISSYIQIPPGNFQAGSILRYLVEQKLSGTQYEPRIKATEGVRVGFSGGMFEVAFKC